ncbi:hypothetical protein [Thermodesulforhabdus norvegica]|uniref:Uncharacterized protein n=1 Tax=Thermodesulforhabdus norvegica TaxID=39841 RepID=A0A1I4R1Z4_9BACT|nr:hypothetical protein [Thermodesulforhabdus norvegica]SFM46125.1 hypothetical protein SAMN05660836_00343 [Thermodesulforhabdus norvegica]
MIQNRKILIVVLGLLICGLLSQPSYAEKEKQGFSQEDRERLVRLETMLEAFKESIDRSLEQIDKRFEQIDKRFEQVDKRFEQIDKRLEFMQNLIIAMIGVFGGLCGVFVGLLLWDRRTFKDKAKEEAMKELEEKYRFAEWFNALREYSKRADDFAEVLRKLNLL